jgi:predicted CopG family antitoxin
MKPTKTIKVEDDTHRRLKLMAAKSGERMYEIVGRLVRAAATNSTQGKGGR